MLIPSTRDSMTTDQKDVISNSPALMQIGDEGHPELGSGSHPFAELAALNLFATNSQFTTFHQFSMYSVRRF